jgi:hypothetical protein
LRGSHRQNSQQRVVQAILRLEVFPGLTPLSFGYVSLIGLGLLIPLSLLTVRGGGRARTSDREALDGDCARRLSDRHQSALCRLSLIAQAFEAG